MRAIRQVAEDEGRQSGLCHRNHPFDAFSRGAQLARMAGISRVVLPGHPHHVTQRGVRSGRVFFSDDDRREYVWILRRNRERPRPKTLDNRTSGGAIAAQGILLSTAGRRTVRRTPTPQ